MLLVVTCDRKGRVLKRELRPGGEPIDLQPLAEFLAKLYMEGECESNIFFAVTDTDLKTDKQGGGW